MGGFRRTGYYKLRQMLRHKNITIGRVSRELNIDLNRLYNATCKVGNANELSFKEILLIRDTYLPDRKLSEVIEQYDNNEHEFDTVYKRESGRRF